MRLCLLIVSAVIAVLIGILAGCSSNSSSAPAGSGLVSVKVSDPATCSGPSGPFNHVYVTITDVKVSTNPNAGDISPSHAGR